ncbi:TonB-dependent siderophore receptor [Vreelandella sp. EE27]
MLVKRRTYQNAAAVGSAALLLGFTPNVLAQATGEAMRLETVTVEGNRLYEMLPSEVTGGYGVDAATVGTKTPASLRDIPQSVSVVTREAIEDQNFTTLDELGRRTPGMRVLSNDNGRSSIYARGFEYDEYSIDGLPAPMTSITGSVPTLSAFDRVEIMRGPSGLFDSTSEMGGIVNLVRKRPTYDPQGRISVGAGTDQQRSAQVDVSGPLDGDDGRVRGRLVLDRAHHGEFVDRNTNQQNDIYAAIDVDLDDSTTFGLGYIHNSKDIRVNNGHPVGPDNELLYGSRSDFFGAGWNDFDSYSNDWIAELTHRFDTGGFGRVAARYSDRNANYNYAFGGSALDADDRLTVAAIGSRIDQQALALDASYSQPFAAFDSVSEFVVGGDYKRFDTETESGRSRSLAGRRVTRDELNELAFVDVLGASRATGSGYAHTDTRLEESGLYGKLTLRPIDPLALIAGTRVSRYDIDFEDKAADTYQDRSDTKVTPYAGVVFDLDENHSLYASYSQVFKPQTAEGPDANLIEPREGDQYEVGVKGSYMNGDLNARLSAFRLYDDNRAGTSPDTGASYSVPIGKMRIQGAEFEVTGSVTDQWDVIAGYTYLDTEVQQSGDAREDAIFLLMPKNIVNLWTQYDFAGEALGGLRVGAGMTAMSDFGSSSGVDAPGYAVFDAMVGYDFSESVSGQLNFNNVFDREYYNRVGGANTFNMPGAPANVMATLSYDF